MTRPHVDEGQQQAALRTGARVLQEQYPHHTQVAISLHIGPNHLNAIAMLKWPGVVRVTLKHTGEFIAQSLPGRPEELDATVAA